MKLTIERLGHHGDGVAEGPVFVPRTLPGECVEGMVEGRRMASSRIVTPSPRRVRPPCPHYRGCGGCALQHADDDFVARWKADVVRAALAAQGVAAPLRPIMTSPPGSRRRATLAGRRGRKGGAMVGFHAPASDQIIAVPQCGLLEPALMAAFPAFEALVAEAASRKDTLTLSATCAPEGIDVDLRGGVGAADHAEQARLAQIAERFGLARLSRDGAVIALARPPAQRFGTARVVPPPGAFLQATREGEAALLQAVDEAVGPGRRVADLFAGCGTFALPLARRAEVHAVESDGGMLEAMERGWRGAQGLRRLTVETRDLFRRPLDLGELAGLDGVVIDPPRAGAEAQCRILARAPIARIAMVSCNPVSFARDARLLIDGGFGLDWVLPVDQFRWSAHVELAAQFTRR